MHLVRVCFVSFFILLLLGVVLLDWFLSDTAPWMQFESSAIARIGDVPFCEYDRSRQLLRERSNALSDFSFLAVGFYMLVQSMEFQTKNRPQQTILSTVNGLANCGHAFGSWLNHACRCQIGHRLDLTGMWLIISFILLFSLTRRASIRTMTFSLIFLLITGVLWSASDIYYPESFETREKSLTTLLCLFFIISEVVQFRYYPMTQGQIQYLALAIVCLTVGILCNHLDATKIVCWPQSWFQLHAFWHICAAGSVWAIYEYFQCEKDLIKTNDNHLA